MRQPIIAGNWKMYKTVEETGIFIEQFKQLIGDNTACEVVLCPPFTSLAALKANTAGTKIALGAQNMHWETQGAYTGEISPAMLVAAGCKYVILGHSERREYFAESDEQINRKIKAALASGLVPILCVGEKLAQREDGSTRQVVRTQLEGCLQGIEGRDIGRIIIAYEPVWAIGTGKTASSQDAEEVIAYIRGVVSELAGQEAAEAVRIQYGGSVKPENIRDLMAMPNIDGALVGGASLEASSFARIVNFE